MSELEIDELIPCISGGCFHGGGCIYWQSVEDGKVDYKKLHELAKTKLTQLLESERVKARIDELNAFEAQLHNNHHNMPIGSPSQYYSEQKNLRINQLQTPKDKGDSNA